jgi:asparagine synthase (glutamine-hydrolysing)
MCGIFGRVSLADLRHQAVSINDALQAIHHRGPDEGGQWTGEGVSLGMRRLSIIDLAGGQQPIWNEDHSCCIVYNGELYNYKELRPQLEALQHVFRTNSDTEVILHAYEQWGVECLRRFNGMFAFAIWDKRARSLFVARDRLGEKPLYYYQAGDELIVASEIKALLADGSIPRTINPRGLANYLTFGHASAPETIYQGIFKLRPGHYLLARGGSVQIAQYWDVGSEPQLPAGAKLSEQEYADRVLALLEDAVRRRMIADVPVGAFLSGGVDSSAVTALMRRYGTGPLTTFSLGFKAPDSYNELSDARRVARLLGTEHHELMVEEFDLIKTVRTLVYHYDEPFGDPANIPVYLLSRFAREHVKVVMTGDGGDELFGGYKRYVADQLAPVVGWLQHLPLAPALIASLERLPVKGKLQRTLRALPIADPARRYAAMTAFFSPALQEELLTPLMLGAVGDHDPASSYVRSYNRLNGSSAADHLNRLMYVDLKGWMVDLYLEKTDKASMAASIEARVPFLDHRLVELAFQIGSRHKIRGLETKRVLKRALRGIVPQEILHKPKHGFDVPLKPWLRSGLQGFMREVLLDQRVRRRGIFNIALVERMLSEHYEGRQIWDLHLWLLLNFELWARIYLDGEAV